MSLYDSASLVMIPSGVKDGKAYSIKPTDGSGDFTFSRDADIEATRVNASGLIEKAKVNNLLQSNSFDTTWANANTSETSGQTGYDGSSDAWLLSKSAAAYAYIYQNITISGVFTFSCYAKAGTLNQLNLWTNNVTRGSFDLASGTSSLGGVTTSIEDVGNGWYRCSAVFNESVSQVRVSPDWNQSTAGNILIQDAQINHGLIAQDYVETTTTAVVEGLTADLPRLDYSGGASCPSLLLEPQRSNTWTYSEPTSGAIGSANSAGAFSDIDSFASIGLYGGAILQGGQTQYIYDGGSVANSTTYTFSCYMKTSDGAEPVLANSNGSATGDFIFIIGGQSKTALDPSINYSITQFSGDIYKVVATMTSNASVTNPSNNGIIKFNTNRNADLEVTGLQWEAASYPTSYIPTYGTAAVRGAELAINNNNTNLPTSYPFTLYSEMDLKEIGDEWGVSFLDDSANNKYNVIGVNFQNKYGMICRPNGSSSFVYSSTDATEGTHKICGVFTETSLKLFVDGVLLGSETNTQSFNSSVNDLLLGTLRSVGDTGIRNTIKQSLVFNTALTDAEAIALTTI